jgi:FKBP-type peptidyl-prolyl cis-trans isomerase 2
MAETAKKKDFVELKYTGYANEKIFDSNIENDLKQIDAKAKPKEFILIIGEGLVVPGLDRALEGKEIGKEYEISVSAKDGFGERKRELVKTIPLKVFSEQKINPYPGLVLSMDNALARIITISGARVMTDFNHPLAGKDLKYKLTIAKKVTDEKEKARTALELVFRFVPEFEIKGEKVIVKGPKGIKAFVESASAKFKELEGKELGFEEIAVKKENENKEVREKAEKEEITERQ